MSICSLKYCTVIICTPFALLYLQRKKWEAIYRKLWVTFFDMSLMESLLFLCSDLEKHIVAEDEKLFLKEKGVNTDEIQGICE